MANSFLFQNACPHCWRPSLTINEGYLYCPTCESKFTEGLKPISGPIVGVYDRSTSSTINAILLSTEGYAHNLDKLYAFLGVEIGSSSEQWVLAAHHITCLYRHYRNISDGLKSGFHDGSTLLSISPSTKRSFPGSFSSYIHDHWRSGDSPFTHLSDNGFRIIRSLEARKILPWPLHRLFSYKRRSHCLSVPRTYVSINDGIDWKAGLQELLADGLIEKASIADNLELISLTKLKSKLREHGVRSGTKRETAIAAALKELPADVLNDLIAPVQGYVSTPITIDEFRLKLYGLPNLLDEVRFHNSIVREKITPDEFLKSDHEFRGTPELYFVLLTLYENARNASNYRTYLESGMPPVEAYLAEVHTELGELRTAHTEIQQAYTIDLQYNDVSQAININHFASLIRFQLQLELLQSQTHTDAASRIQATEKTLMMWIALYDRIADDGSTPFLLDYYEEIFNAFSNCSRESENKHRELRGVPRIGEGWVSEVELLNIVRDIYPSEKVLHQASPDWLGLQRLDVFIPRLKIAIEYQGKQHYEPVEFFGGEDAFLRNQERDKRKANLCAQHGVFMLYFRYDEVINRDVVESRIKQAITYTHR